jgi:hypothetical protein
LPGGPPFAPLDLIAATPNAQDAHIIVCTAAERLVADPAIWHRYPFPHSVLLLRPFDPEYLLRLVAWLLGRLV